MSAARLDPEAASLLRSGQVIPAHPLALTSQRALDERRQRALTRYYAAAGAGGVAVGVHTTQFEIREPAHDLLRPVLELAADTLRAHEEAGGGRMLRVAGVCGPTPRAVAEAVLARELGYDLGLLSLAGLDGDGDEELLAHCRAVGEAIPLFGFYLQPAVGGRSLGHGFWRRLCELEALAAIKVAPFDRYATLDVLRAVAESGRAQEVALYTGNDDHIVPDLQAEHRFRVGAETVAVRFAGGLLGQWAVWTRRAVELLEAVRGGAVDPALAGELTDANAAIFDAAHGFRGCVPGIHEVLRRQGLLAGTWCLDERAALSPGQADEIDRVCAAYPHLTDDAFVTEGLAAWLG